jgi:hypothetical protein
MMVLERGQAAQQFRVRRFVAAASPKVRNPVASGRAGASAAGRLERFQAKWKPVRVKKTRQIKNLEPRFDSIEAGL